MKATMKNIYTVVITSKMGDLSTCSFEEFNDAVEYCIEEMHATSDNHIEFDDDKVRDALYDQMYYEFLDFTFWIEDAKLVGRSNRNRI